MDRLETQSLERGLEVLSCLTRAGALTVAEVSARTRLPEPTVRRLLNTLHALGYVTQSRAHQPYRATLKLIELASTLPLDTRLQECARLAIRDIPRSYPWPVAFLQWQGDALVVQETAARKPTLEPTRYIGGWRTRAPFGAGGFVVAAYGPAAVRRVMTEQYRTARRKTVRDLAESFEGATAATTIRTEGYFVWRTPGRKEMSVAVPVFVEKSCVGALESRIVGADKARIIGTLQKCAAEIARLFRQFNRIVSDVAVR